MLDITSTERAIRQYCEDVFETETGIRANAYKKWTELKSTGESKPILRIVYDILRLLDGGNDDSN